MPKDTRSSKIMAAIQVSKNEYLSSRLYHLKLIGTGTEHVESLASYSGRLASVHCVTVGTLVSKEIVPVLNKPWMVTQRGYILSPHSPQTTAICGAGRIAIDWVAALERLTLRHHLKYGTMLPWAAVIAQKNLIRKFRVWCPECYEQQFHKGVVYDPLLWSLEAVTLCKIHRRQLSKKCRICNRSLPVIGSKYVPGLCSRCGNWLGTSEPQRILANWKSSNFEFWKVESIGNLLAVTPAGSNLSTRDAFMASIEIAVKWAGSLTALASLSGFDPQTIRAWRTARLLPRLSAVCKLAWALHSPLFEFLTGCWEPKAKFLGYRPPNDKKKGNLLASDRMKKSRRKPAQIKKLLEKALKEVPVPSLSEVAKRIKYEKSSLYKRHNSLARSIAKAHKNCSENTRRNRNRSVRLILENALTEIPPPSVNKMKKRIFEKFGWRLNLNKLFPELCGSISRRFFRYRAAATEEFRNEIRDEIKEVVAQLLTHGIYPSNKIVASRMSRKVTHNAIWFTEAVRETRSMNLIAETQKRVS
ncbi:TniQ family protein [bacterium]|nr:TniQ family protein [bacterium]